MKVKVTIVFEHDDAEPERGETAKQWAERKWVEEGWYITDCADCAYLVKVEEVIVT